MTKAKPIIAIIMGSQSDWATMKHTTLILEELGVPYEAKIISAHRTPARLSKYAESARERGLKVLIAGAGMAAALPGAAAALTPLPVLGVPMDGKVMGGLDALLAMSQMPAGIPVGTLAIGKAGAINSGILAASIIALNDPKVAAALDKFRANQTTNVTEDPID
ncbi:MAG TPA: 5-(carboxyamino)imidazole ribonucleotide mutase [Rhodospirillales bacterium]|jgi:5-(carboxyamino)imidazole ribonucleotide mutase|nr:5-(carboxyamino)imidazole ribonucleotide mutase [Rhodospirillales bacterium]HIL75767.1 5-(carboxyamino)imidazole ribonucleotide mutase [Rhodospirillales bacterium]